MVLPKQKQPVEYTGMQKCSFFSADQYSGDLAVEDAWVYIPGGSPKNKKMVYTPLGSSPTINVMVYAHFVSLPKLKISPFTLVIFYRVKSMIQEIKNKSDNI